MLFNSISFLIFLPIVFFLYWLNIQRKERWQNAVLLFASYIFYGWWDWRFLLLLAFSTLLDYLAGMAIETTTWEGRKKLILWTTVILNLLILGFFKYFNFFISSATSLLETLGFQVNPWTLNIILPIGISFYTFHGLSYVIDIYFGRIRSINDPFVYSVFVCYFPLLVAGPIERATHLLPQLQKRRTFDYHMAIDGFRIILWGFFKKLVIADLVAVEVDRIFQDHTIYGGVALILGSIYFAIQVYADFSGYTDIARGVSRLFGIEVLENFRSPYLSRSIPEFWSRWHISLSSWLNDYVFTPIAIEWRGMGRHGIMLAVMITFIISGLWGGPAWHFVIWGALHGLYYLPHVYRKKGVRSLAVKSQGAFSWKDLPAILLTFSLVCIGYVFFRSVDLQQAIDYFSGMASHPWSLGGYFVKWNINLLLLSSILIDILAQKGYFSGRYNTFFLLLESLILGLLIFTVGNFGSVEFIYFQF